MVGREGSAALTYIIDYKLTLMLNPPSKLDMGHEGPPALAYTRSHRSAWVADRDIKAQLFFEEKKKEGTQKSSSEYFRLSAG